MTVNINTSTPTHKSNTNNTAAEIQSIAGKNTPQPNAEALNKLSSGVALPDPQTKNDSSEISMEGSEKTATASISQMQKEVSTIEAFQAVIESVAEDIWSIEEQVTQQQQVQDNPDQPTQMQTVETERQQSQAMVSPEIAEDDSAQKVVDSRLASIDEKGGELLQYIDGFREAFITEIQEINSKFLGRVQKDDEDYSLSSLNNSVSLDSPVAKSVVNKAQGDIAEIQVSIETHRNNMLHEINNTIGSAINNLENPASRSSENIDDSIAEISSMLLNNPTGINSANSIDNNKVAKLLL